MPCGLVILQKDSSLIHNLQKLIAIQPKNVDCSPSAIGLKGKGEKLDEIRFVHQTTPVGIASFLLHRAKSANRSDVIAIPHAPL
jgi:hypothetical protein